MPETIRRSEVQGPCLYRGFLEAPQDSLGFLLGAFLHLWALWIYQGIGIPE